MADNKLQYDVNATLDLTVMDKFRFQIVDDFIINKILKNPETLAGKHLSDEQQANKAEIIEQLKYISQNVDDFAIVKAGDKYKIKVKEACKLHYDNPDFEHEVTLNVGTLTMRECLKPLNFNGSIYHDSRYDAFISGIQAANKLFAEGAPVTPVEIVIDCAGSEIKVVRFVKKESTEKKYITDFIADQGELTIPDLETEDYEEYVNQFIADNPNEYMVFFLPRQHHIPDAYLADYDVTDEDAFETVQ